MPTPTKMWAEDGTLVTQPPDSFIERGLDPTLPLPMRYVNWFLNFIQETLFGAEHNPLTGAHSDITADSVTTDTLNVDNGPINFDVAYGSWVVDEDYKYEAAPTRTAKIGTSRWQFSVDPYANGALNAGVSRIYLAETGLYEDDLWIDIDDIIGASRASTDNLVLTACSLFLQRSANSTSGSIDWVLEGRDVTGLSVAFAETVASGTIVSADVAAYDPQTTFSSVVLWLADKTLTAGKEYRLRLSCTGGTVGIRLLGGLLVYKPARIIAT